MEYKEICCKLKLPENTNLKELLNVICSIIVPKYKKHQQARTLLE